MAEKKAVWPISERGSDMEDSVAQMQAKDRINFLNLARAKKKSDELTANWLKERRKS